MAKNDFDIDFDFEKEYGFDPKAILDSKYTDEDLDLSQFDQEDLSLDLGDESADGLDDLTLDLDDLGLDLDLDDLDLDEAGAEPAAAAAPVVQEEPVFDQEPEEAPEAASAREPEAEADMDLDDLEDLDDLDLEDMEDMDFGDEDEDFAEDQDEDMAFTRRANFFGVDTGVMSGQVAEEEPEEEDAYFEEPVYQEPVYEQTEYTAVREPSFEEPVQEEAGYQDYDQEVCDEEVTEEQDAPAVRRRAARPKKERKPIKLTMPPILANLKRLYIPNHAEISARLESGDGRRRRKPSKQQIFKEFYLPAIILGLSIVLMLSFVIGATSNAIDNAKLKREQEEEKAKQESIAAEMLETEGRNLMDQAEKLAMGYDYDGAIQTLDSYRGEASQEMTAKRAEYMDAKRGLVEHQDPTLIPNLSFHVLIADMARAVADDENGGQYNRNFVSTTEFQRILEQLYANNYVLVDFDSFVAASSMDGVSEIYDKVPLYLPQGKKPVMLSETLVNYFEYMDGCGIASRLVVDGNGDIKAEYKDANGVTQVGNYDLVPILEDFIKDHPDFSYRGARATLAVTGYEGIFGYRIQSETQSNKGAEAYNQEVVGATRVVNALREKGYRLACNSFQNKDYSNISADMVKQDLDKWRSQISSVIGEVDTIIFARGKDIGEYTGGKFDVLMAAGFRYLIKSGEAPFTEINNSYVRQTRLMVTGENMVGKASMFTGLFDPNLVLELTTRGNVPVG